MTTRVSLTFEGETIVDVYAAMRVELARVEGNHAGLIPAPAVPTVHLAPEQAPSCPQGHGTMALIPGGTAKSGPRIGQPYPPFYKCGVCQTKAEAT